MTTEKRSTGTALIVWGSALLVLAVIGIAQIPETLTKETFGMLGGLVGTVVFAALGVLLLVLGLNKRRASAS